MMQPNSKTEKPDFRTNPGNNTVETSHEQNGVETHEIIMMAKKTIMSKEEREIVK